MTRVPDDELIETLVANVRPVRPLASPVRRAGVALGAFAVVGAILILLGSNPRQFAIQHAGRETMLALEMIAMLATGALAVLGAFFTSVPGRSRRWLVAPLPFLAAWLLLSGAGCYSLMVQQSAGQGLPSQQEDGDSLHCLLFILAASAVLAPPLIWNLSRAAPIDPRPVALLGGLGVAALSAFLLQFFHGFSVTLLDLAVHALAVLLVVGGSGLFGRRALSTD